ncbi:MAG: hypothetical protein HY884_00610 [Deltaproteobacteria bacterium]|nr:hypothetical protein [Deltaproteobacteria bacterium]
MKRFLAIALVASIGLFAAANTAHAVYATENNTWDKAGVGYADGDIANGIADSRHNLGKFGEHILSNSGSAGAYTVDTSNAGAGYLSTGGTTEICVFCHTPHHANNVFTGSNPGTKAPLWNKGVASTASYTSYNAGGTNLSTAGTDTSMKVGSQSLACLSCHDGVSTFDNIVNLSGKGGVTTGGSTRGYSFFDNGGTVAVSNVMTSSRLNLGQDLSNDHPVSVAYTVGRAGLRATTNVISAIEVNAGLNGSASAYDGGNINSNLWDVNGYIGTTATIGDLLKTNASGASKIYVECTSCHDPHFKNQSWNEIESPGYTGVEIDGLFLRRVGGNTGSGVCRTCHAK